MMMMLLFLLLHGALFQSVFSQDEKRLVLRGGSNPCEGHVEVLYDDKWGLVGDKFWSHNTEKVVCRSTHCGEPVEGQTTDVWRPDNTTLVWLNELRCAGNESELWSCPGPGWNISFYRKPTVKKVKCSNEIRFALDGPKCAGAVQYFTGRAEKPGYICNDTWGKKEADLLCKHLDCGEGKSIPRAERMTGKDFQGSETMRLKCSEELVKSANNPWQCAAPNPAPCLHPATVICSGHERLQIKASNSRCSGQLQKEENGKWVIVNNNNTTPEERCRQIHCGAAVEITRKNKSLYLKCTDKVQVVLKNNGQESRCYGTVHVKVNRTTEAVCGSTWTEKDAQVVCKELDCGSVNAFSRRGGSGSGIMDYVECLGNESSLWHCQAKHGKDLPCPDAPYVVCSGSLKVKLVDGGSPCAGRLEVEHEGQWKRVHKNGWEDDHSNKVCENLGCGKQIDTDEKYSQGSGTFLAAKCKGDINSVTNITECITTNLNNQQREEEAVGITCEEHKVVFLNGSCSGPVGIKHGNNTFWFSGSKATWTKASADTVCRQMHCGKASKCNFSNSTNAENIWPETYSCSSNDTSLLSCSKTTLPPDYNETIAYVKCTGNITVSLTNGCWGNVNVCVGGECGGVCADAWTKSEMLCDAENCGKVLDSFGSRTQTEVMFKSLHAMQPNADLSECIFIRKQANDRTCVKPASVVCSGSVEARFSASRDKCSGNVEVRYEGNLLPVCKDALNDPKTQKAICGELKCGDALKVTDYFGKKSSTQVIKQLQCPDGASSLRDCDIIPASNDACDLGGLQCSGWKKVALEPSNTCEGEVVVYSEEGVSVVSSHGWTDTEAQRLCQDMECGSGRVVNKNVTWLTMGKSFFEGSFNCSGEEPQSIWDCGKKDPPSEKKTLVVECRNETKVTLSNKCHGELRINNVPVCASQWKKSYSDMVCQELDCSNAVSLKANVKPTTGVNYHHIRCDEQHHELGQCNRFQGSCVNEDLVYIYCVGNIKFRTTEQCGGNIQINYRDRWERVCMNELSEAVKNKLCEGINRTETKLKTSQKPETSLACTENHMDVRYCVKDEPCGTQTAATINCEGCTPKPKETREKPSDPTVPIIVGVGFLFVLVTLIAVGARLYLVRRNRKSMMMLPSKEVEFESGEYEHVENEMEDFRGGRFRSDSDFAREDERRSDSPLPYDDIEELAEAQPLTAAADAADASEGGSMHEDKVTYEGEDPQDNYDDIEAAPEITKAEVHDSPKATSGHDAAAPPGPVQGDGDYLVPGQDG